MGIEARLYWRVVFIHGYPPLKCRSPKEHSGEDINFNMIKNAPSLKQLCVLKTVSCIWRKRRIYKITVLVTAN